MRGRRTGATHGPAARRCARICLWLILVSVSLSAVADGLDVTVDVTGLDGDLESNVRLFLGIEQQRNNPLLSVAGLRRLHRRARGEIAEALKPFGWSIFGVHH